MKKILCLMLCLMMLIPAAVSQAEETPITSISLTVTVPTAGETAATRPKVTVPSGSPYVVYAANWISDDYNDGLPENYVFEAGKVYNILLSLITASNDYVFQSPTFHITNGTFASIYNGIMSPGNMSIVLKVTIPFIEKVNLSKPKSVRVKSVSAKKLEVTWRKLSAKDRKKIRQFEIQVSTDKQFTKIVRKKLVSSKKTSWTIPGLKKNTKYYVRIRAYTKSGNFINMSKWVVKSKKTKKK